MFVTQIPPIGASLHSTQYIHPQEMYLKDLTWNRWHLCSYFWNAQQQQHMFDVHVRRTLIIKTEELWECSCVSAVNQGMCSHLSCVLQISKLSQRMRHNSRRSMLLSIHWNRQPPTHPLDMCFRKHQESQNLYFHIKMATWCICYITDKNIVGSIFFYSVSLGPKYQYNFRSF